MNSPGAIQRRHCLTPRYRNAIHRPYRSSPQSQAQGAGNSAGRDALFSGLTGVGAGSAGWTSIVFLMVHLRRSPLLMRKGARGQLSESPSMPTHRPRATGFFAPGSFPGTGWRSGQTRPSGLSSSSGQTKAVVVVAVAGIVVVAVGRTHVPAVVDPATAAQHAPLALFRPPPEISVTPPAARPPAADAATGFAGASSRCRRAG